MPRSSTKLVVIASLTVLCGLATAFVVYVVMKMADDAEKGRHHAKTQGVSGDGTDSMHVPSPQEYLMGVFASTAALRTVAISTEAAARQRALVSEKMHAALDSGASTVQNREVWDLSWPYRVLSLTHALTQVVEPRFKLSSAQQAEIERLARKGTEKRRAELEGLRETCPCIATEEWFDKQCVKPGAFYTREFMERHLLSGVPYSDLFYWSGPSERERPKFMDSLIRFAERCSKDVWCDSAVVAGIADIMGSHCLEKRWLEIQHLSKTVERVEVPTQEALDVICGKMTALYRDAILRRVDWNELFGTLQETSRWRMFLSLLF